jgi:hypothetical protein
VPNIIESNKFNCHTHENMFRNSKTFTCKLQEFMFTTITTKHVSPLYFGISKHEK